MHIKKRISILVIMLFFAFMGNVNAVYESNSGVAFTGSSQVNCGNTKNCYKKTVDFYYILQARLYYINNKSFTQIGSTYFFVNSAAYTALNGKVPNLIKITNFDGYTMKASSYQNGYNYLKNTYFKDATKTKKFLNDITNSDDYDEVLNKINQSQGGSKGYRIVIEPALNYANPTFLTSDRPENAVLYTVKGLASEINNLGEDAPKELVGADSRAQWLYNDFADVGLSKQDRYSCEDLTVEQLGDVRYACGYKFIDISSYISTKKCYTEDGVRTKNGGIKCDNYDKNNEETYSPKYKETSCDGKTESEQLSILAKYGKLVTGTNSCGIYCTESAELSFPGNVLNPIQKGSYFVWPTRAEDTTGKYKMNIKTTLKCHTVGTEASTVASTYERNCPSGYSEYQGEGYDICRKNADTTKTCPKGYVSYDSNTCRSTKHELKVCEEGYSTYNSSLCISNTPVSKVCPDDHPTMVNGKCRNDNKTSKTCPSTYPNHVSGTICRSNNGTSLNCPDKFPTSVNATTCRGNQTTSKVCPSTHTTSVNSTTCRNNSTKNKTCPSNYPTVVNSTTCRNNTTKDKVCPSGYGTSVNATTCRNNTTKDLVCPSGYGTSVNATTCRSNTRVFKTCSVSGKVNIDGNVCARINNNPVTKAVATDLTKVTNACPDGYTATGQGGNNACVKDVVEWKCDPGFTEYPGSEWEWLCRKEECGYTGGGSSTVWGKYYTLQNHFCSTGNVSYGGYTWYSSGSQTSCTGHIYGVNYNQGCCSMSRTKSNSGTWTCWTTEHIGYRDYHTKDYKPYKAAYCRNGNTMNTDCKCPSGYKYVAKDGDGHNANICVKEENCSTYYTKATVNHSDGTVALAGKCWYDGDQKYNNCPAGTVADATKGYCYKTASKVCPSGTVNVSGKCYQSANKACPSNTVEVNGKCYASTKIACPSGTVEVNGVCYESANKVCPSNSVNVNGTCYVTRDKECPSGSVRVGDKCYKSTSIACPSGTVESNGECYTAVDPICPSGSINSGGKCYKRANKVCRKGTVLVNGMCYQRVAKECDKTERKSKCYKEAHGTDGFLVTTEYTDERKCPAGSEEINGKCYKTTNNKVCPNGYTFIDGGKWEDQACFKVVDAVTKNQTSCNNGKTNIDNNGCYNLVKNPDKKNPSNGTVISDKCPDGYTATGQGGDKACSKEAIEWRCADGWTRTESNSWDYMCKSCTYSPGGSNTTWGKSYSIQNHFCSPGTASFGGYSWTITGSQASCDGYVYGVNYNQGCCWMYRSSSYSGSTSCDYQGLTPYSVKDYEGFKGVYCSNGNDPTTECKCPKGYKYIAVSSRDVTVNKCIKNPCDYYHTGINWESAHKTDYNFSVGNDDLDLTDTCHSNGEPNVALHCEVITNYYSTTEKDKNGKDVCKYCPTNVPSYHKNTDEYEKTHTNEYGQKVVNLQGKCTGDNVKTNCSYKNIINGKCREEVPKSECPASHPLKDKDGKCYRNLDKSEHYCKTGTYISKTDSCIVCEKGTPTSDGTCRYSEVCTLPTTVQIGTQCYTTTNKENRWNCPPSFVLKGTTCINSCSKDSLISGLENEIKKGASIKLTAGTNRKIDDELDTVVKTTVDNNSLTFISITDFKIGSSVNRYYNKETGKVADSTSGWNAKDVFDRKEGVVSLGINDSNDTGTLVLSNMKFGTVINYGNYINNYTCKYNITTNPPCRCPSGTDFAGTSVYDLIDNIYGIAENQNGTCADLQYKICNKPAKYYCKNKNNNTKVDVTTCVENGIKSGASAYNSYLKCRDENTACAPNTCSGTCVVNTISSGNVGLSVKKCNGKTCIITPLCPTNQIVSPSSLDYIAEKLHLNGVQGLKDAFDNNKINNSQLKAILKQSESAICENQRIIFRIVDLSNPFYGNQITGLSLTNNKSRVPGANWNSEQLVFDRILKARNKNGIGIYEKTPLYTITLTPQSIKNIRQYNSKNKYTKFNLNCNDSDRTYGCISEFIHGDSDSLKSLGATITGVDNCTKINIKSKYETYKLCYYNNN